MKLVADHELGSKPVSKQYSSIVFISVYDSRFLSRVPVLASLYEGSVYEGTTEVLR